MSHTLEPWVLGKANRYGDTPINANDWCALATVVTRMDGQDEPCADGVANARRIVACVNACAGIDVQFLENISTDEHGSPKSWIKALSMAIKQRDELMSALVSIERAYSNKHSPQHRASCLTEARTAIAKAEAAK